MRLSVAVQVVDSGFTLDPTAAARQFKIPPRNVRYHMREEASPGPQGSRILADLLSGKIQVAAGKKTPAPKKRRVQSTPVTGLRIDRQVPRPAPGSHKRKADGPLAKKASFKRQPAMVQKDYKENAEEYKRYKEAYKLATENNNACDFKLKTHVSALSTARCNWFANAAC